MKISEQDWAQVGKSLYFCSGLACLAFAIANGNQPGVAAFLLRLWVGGFGALVAIHGLRKARPSKPDS